MYNPYNYKVKKNKNKQLNMYLILFGIFLLLIFMGYSYSFFSDKLKINMNVSFKPYFENLDLIINPKRDVSVISNLKNIGNKKYKANNLISFVEINDQTHEEQMLITFNYKNKNKKNALSNGSVSARVVSGSAEAIKFYDPPADVSLNVGANNYTGNPNGTFLAFLPVSLSKVNTDTIIEYKITYDVKKGNKTSKKAYYYYVVLTKKGFPNYDKYKKFLGKDLIKSRNAYLLNENNEMKNETNNVENIIDKNTINDNVVNNSVVNNSVVNNSVSNNINDNMNTINNSVDNTNKINNKVDNIVDNTNVGNTTNNISNKVESNNVVEKNEVINKNQDDKLNDEKNQEVQDKENVILNNEIIDNAENIKK